MNQGPNIVPKKQKNPLWEILFNIVIPVVLLNKLSKYFGENGPLVALLVALSFPIVYALYEYLKEKKKNIWSLVGVVNILLTGGLALMQLEGIWFAVKEAAIPLAIGIAVLISAFYGKPLIKLIIYNDNLIQTELIEAKLREHLKWDEFQQHLKTSTIYLSLSFFVSAILNFVLAKIIFTDIPNTLTELEKSTMLNEQIARMTWLSYIVIMVPSMLILLLVLWHLFRGIKQMTGLSFNEYLRDMSKVEKN
jgi:intracellular septation protein A